MYPHDQRVKCDRCPVTSGVCLGEQVPRLCVLARTRLDYRNLLVERARTLGRTTTPAASNLAERLAAVRSCPHRGEVLPHTLQPDCGCAELSRCRADRGDPPGRATLDDCLLCVSA